MSHQQDSPPHVEEQEGATSLSVMLQLQPEQPGSPVAVFLTPVKQSVTHLECGSSMKFLRPPATPAEERFLLSSVRTVLRDHLQSVKKGGEAERAAAVRSATADFIQATAHLRSCSSPRTASRARRAR